MLKLMAFTLAAAFLFAIASIIIGRFTATPPLPPASPQEPLILELELVRRAARSSGGALSTKTKPRRLRGLAVQRTGRRGSGGIGGQSKRAF